MHHQILRRTETSDTVPVANFHFRENIPIRHRPGLIFIKMVVNIITDNQINLFFFPFPLIELRHQAPKSLLIQPVIRIYYFKVGSSCSLQACINCRSMSSVFFMNYFYYIRILFGITVCNQRRIVIRTVIYNNDFRIRSACQQ